VSCSLPQVWRIRTSSTSALTHTQIFSAIGRCFVTIILMVGTMCLWHTRHWCRRLTWMATGVVSSGTAAFSSANLRLTGMVRPVVVAPAAHYNEGLQAPCCTEDAPHSCIDYHVMGL
jgi:hypothetical protein